MLKCRDCFCEKLRAISGEGQQLRSDSEARMDPTLREENLEIVRIALAKSADAVIINSADSLCEVHLLERTIK